MRKKFVIFLIMLLLFPINVKAETTDEDSYPLEMFSIESYNMTYPSDIASVLLKKALTDYKIDSTIQNHFQSYGFDITRYPFVLVQYADFNKTSYRVVFGATKFKHIYTDKGSSWQKESLSTNGYFYLNYDLDFNLISTSVSKSANTEYKVDIVYKYESPNNKLIAVSEPIIDESNLLVYKEYYLPNWQEFGLTLPKIYSNEVPDYTSYVDNEFKNVTIVLSSDGFYYLFCSTYNFLIYNVQNNYEYYNYLSFVNGNNYPYLNGTTQFDTSKVKAYYYHPDISENWLVMDQLPSTGNRSDRLYLLPNWVVENETLVDNFKPYLDDGLELQAGTIDFASYYSNGNLAFSLFANYDLKNELGFVYEPSQDILPDLPGGDSGLDIPVFSEIIDAVNYIIDAIVGLPKKIVDLFADMFEFLFVPKEGVLEEWFTNIRTSFNKQFGFLAYPFEWIIGFLEKLLTIEDTGSYVISWNDVKVPVYDLVLIESGSFDMADFLENDNLKLVHDTYFIVIDGMLAFAFLQLCLKTYHEIIDMNHSIAEFEYVTVDSGFDYNAQTGEAKRGWFNTRTTTRERKKKK